MKIKLPLPRFVSYVSITFFCSYLASCDPALLVTVTNKTRSPAYFSMADKSLKGSDSLFTRTLAPRGNGKKSRATMYYGIGGWGDVALAEMAQRITRLEVASSHDTIVLTDSTRIRDFLATKRKGIFQSRIEIEIR